MAAISRPGSSTINVSGGAAVGNGSAGAGGRAIDSTNTQPSVSVNKGSTYTLTLTYGNPVYLFYFSVNWGDGSSTTLTSSQNERSVSHSYKNTGTDQIQVTVYGLSFGPNGTFDQASYNAYQTVNVVPSGGTTTGGNRPWARPVPVGPCRFPPPPGRRAHPRLVEGPKARIPSSPMAMVRLNNPGDPRARFDLRR